MAAPNCNTFHVNNTAMLVSAHWVLSTPGEREKKMATHSSDPMLMVAAALPHGLPRRSQRTNTALPYTPMIHISTCCKGPAGCITATLSSRGQSSASSAARLSAARSPPAPLRPINKPPPATAPDPSAAAAGPARPGCRATPTGLSWLSKLTASQNPCRMILSVGFRSRPCWNACACRNAYKHTHELRQVKCMLGTCADVRLAGVCLCVSQHQPWLQDAQHIARGASATFAHAYSQAWMPLRCLSCCCHLHTAAKRTVHTMQHVPSIFLQHASPSCIISFYS